MNDDRISVYVYVRKVKDGYRARVLVNGEFYASVEAPEREAALAQANHYAAQIEFDEDGNW